MHRIYARIPAHFYRISLHCEEDSMTMALVPDQDHAHLIAKLLSAHYGLRLGERIIVAPTMIRPSGALEATQLEYAIK